MFHRILLAEYQKYRKVSVMPLLCITCIPRKMCCSTNLWHLWIRPFFGNRGFAKTIKIRSFWIQWALNSMTDGFMRREIWSQRHRRGRGRTAMRWRQRLEWCSVRPRNAKDFRELTDAKRQILSLGPLEEIWSSDTPWLQISGFQNCEIINLCCFKPLTLW